MSSTVNCQLDDGMPMLWQIDRNIPTLIEQGCQWLNHGYFELYTGANHQWIDRGIDSNLQHICKH